MSFLRRRLGGKTGDDGVSDELSRTPSPVKAASVSEDGTSVTVAINKLNDINEQLLKSKKSPGAKRRSAWVFILGGLFGVALALFFAGSNDVIDLAALKSMNLDSILDVLPAGLVKDAQELTVRTYFWELAE